MKKHPAKTPARSATRDPAGSPPAALPPPRRILVVDDHPFMRAGLAQLIARQPDLAVCGEAGNPAEAFRELARGKPDLVLTDLTMPGRSGLEFIKDLQAAEPRLAVLVISMHDEAIYGKRVRQAGGSGYIMKDIAPDSLIAAIHTVLAGGVFLNQSKPRRI